MTFLLPGCLALLSWGCVENNDDAALPVPAELSQGAKDFYALRPQPIEGLDLDDREAVANARAAIEEAWRAVLPNIGLTPIEDRFEIAGVKVNLISWPTMRDDGRLVIYLHGGAYVVGSATANIVLPARLGTQPAFRYCLSIIGWRRMAEFVLNVMPSADAASDR